MQSEHFDDFEQCALKRLVHAKVHAKVHAMYLDGEKVTLDTMTAAVQEKMDKTVLSVYHSENSCHRSALSSET